MNTASLRGSAAASGCKYGNAILAKGKGSVGAINHYLLFSADVEQRAITCIDAYVPIGIRSCVTHLTPGSSPGVDRRNQQLGQIESIVNPYVNAFIGVFLGGDFNVEPYGDGSVLNKIYSSSMGGFGGFVEVEAVRASCITPTQQPCEPTFGNKKIDYIFIDKYNWPSYSASTSSPSGSMSDHRVLNGHAYH